MLIIVSYVIQASFMMNFYCQTKTSQAWNLKLVPAHPFHWSSFCYR